MIPNRFRRPLTVVAAVLAVLSLAAVGVVMAIAAGGGIAPAWVTATALYGLPIAFILLVYLVVDSVLRRRQQ
ncbi:hypothetical protein [Arthrobacter sp. M4]|uniref:hypothetical protein n=1 Tax=Arthrobacter sp. M4 TaxID=218160 RepID=UPI001CDBF5C3|nr:hypothetical protein [Arthrobacter sp. M4]MCA4133823.1 hypothetical protein [Arthrobacter sp. M4]